MSHLLEDWLSHGPGVLAQVRQDDPSTYLRVAFSVIPKDSPIQNPGDHYSSIGGSRTPWGAVEQN
jgi:hypothetical protein